MSPEPTCSYCGRVLHPWPLKRGGKCAPKEWVNCIRNQGIEVVIHVREADNAK